MKKIISNKVGSIMKDKNKIEKVLKVKMTNRGKEIFIKGEPTNEYETEKVIDAINAGFSIETALIIKTKELSFEILNIKDFTKRKNLQRIRGRIIGTKGKTLSTLTHLADCFFEISNNNVGIIGPPEKMKTAQEALVSLIKGSKQANVYKYLEKHQTKPILDLGLKTNKFLNR